MLMIRELKAGDAGQDVQALQHALNQLNAGLVEDGKFGGKTSAAVAKFQTHSLANILDDPGRNEPGTATKWVLKALGIWTPHCFGIDVSKWQGEIDWDAVAKTQYRFCYIKATQGIRYRSPTLTAHYEGAKRIGMKVGVYHFADMKADPEDEIEHLLGTIRGQTHDLAVALDVEGALPRTPAKARRWVLEWLHLAEKRTNKVPTLYTSTRVCRERLGFARGAPTAYGLERSPLWHPRYPRAALRAWDPEIATLQPDPDPFPEIAIWQFSAYGQVPGIRGNCDLNLMATDLFGLDGD